MKARNISKWACKEINLLGIIYRKMETQKYLLSSPSLLHDLSVCKRSWIDNPRKYSSLFHYRQNKSKAVETQAFYFLNIPAYLSLLISLKGWKNPCASTGLIGGLPCNELTSHLQLYKADTKHSCSTQEHWIFILYSCKKRHYTQGALILASFLQKVSSVIERSVNNKMKQPVKWSSCILSSVYITYIAQ